jgi:Domain of unknown function (DUF4389)
LRTRYRGVYGAAGFFDAVNPVTGAVSHRDLVLDQSMIMAAIANALTDRAIQRDFAWVPACPDPRRRTGTDGRFADLRPSRRGTMVRGPHQVRRHVMNGTSYPVTFSVDYPDRELNRLTSFFRIFAAIPIGIVLGTVAGGTWSWSYHNGTSGAAAGAGGLLFFGPLLMILFRQKYPRWWFDWNLELQRFSNRVLIYLALMDDRYPATDDQQSVRLDYQYPEAARDLNRWLPLVKWLLAIPHYIVLFFLDIAALAVVIVAWFAILFTGRYPRELFDFVAGVVRWHNRVVGYALTLVTDAYPPFRLAP